MNRRTPRAVLFDLGNTLVSYYKPAEFGPILNAIVDDLLRYLAQQGRRYDSPRVTAKAHALNVERADLSVLPLLTRLQEIFSLDDAFAAAHGGELMRIFLARVFATAQLDPHAVPLLAALKERGIRTGIVSNTPWGSPAALWRTELERHGIVSDATVFCTDCGKRKPDPAIFSFALDRVGVPAAEAVFVGDDPRWDVFGARRAGMRAILLEPADVAVPGDVERIRRLPELLPLLQPR